MRQKDKDILNAFLNVPRELFVKKSQIKHSYIDDNLCILKNRYLISPVIFARLVQSLKLKKNQTILHIASGTGYGVVILSYLTNTVLGIESDKKLIASSSEILSKLKVDNAAILKGNIHEGFAKQAPYDAILIEGSVNKVPSNILNQLCDEGKLVTVENINSNCGSAIIYQRLGENYIKNVLFDAHLPLLTSFNNRQTFVF